MVLVLMVNNCLIKISMLAQLLVSRPFSTRDVACIWKVQMLHSGKIAYFFLVPLFLKNVKANDSYDSSHQLSFRQSDGRPTDLFVLITATFTLTRKIWIKIGISIQVANKIITAYFLT